jgi:hypothetical protein
MCRLLTMSWSCTPLGISDGAQVRQWWGQVFRGHGNDRQWHILSRVTKRNPSGPLQNLSPDAPRNLTCSDPHWLSARWRRSHNCMSLSLVSTTKPRMIMTALAADPWICLFHSIWKHEKGHGNKLKKNQWSNVLAETIGLLVLAEPR